MLFLSWVPSFAPWVCRCLSEVLPIHFIPRRSPMEIAASRVASIHYTLTDDAGQVIGKSPESQPLSYLNGASNIVPGLEIATAEIGRPSSRERVYTYG